MSKRAAALLVSALMSCAAATARAGSAQWNQSPVSGNWQTTDNWTPTTIPNGAADTAYFGPSNVRSVSLSGNVQVSGVTFTPGAGAYELRAPAGVTLTISGAGITNDSGSTQDLRAENGNSSSGTIIFSNAATAGTRTVVRPYFLQSGTTAPAIVFKDTSTAGSSSLSSISGSSTTFNNSSSASNASIHNSQGATTFTDNSTAANARITSNFGSTIFRKTSTAANATLSSIYVSGIAFYDSATAGSATIDNLEDSLVGFYDSSTAGNATIRSSGRYSAVSFSDNSTAANARIDNSGYGGRISFARNASAGSSTITTAGGSERATLVAFYDTSTADAATLVANSGPSSGVGGQISLYHNSTGGTARVQLFGNGSLNHYARAATIGSIEGNGIVFLRAGNLAVGSNNVTTTFSGVIRDGTDRGERGSLSKIGNGVLTLSGANTYHGRTTIEAGELIVAGSVIGTSGVKVRAGATLTVKTGGTIILDGGTLLVQGTLLNSGTIRVKQGIATEHSGNTFIITFNGLTGRLYRVQSSSSLEPQSFVDTGFAQFGDSQNVLTFIDPNATGARRFYRIVEDSGTR